MEGNNAHFNLGFELLIVDIDGILPVVLCPSSQQAVGHLNVQQVVQHLDLGLYHKRHLSLYIQWTVFSTYSTYNLKIHGQNYMESEVSVSTTNHDKRNKKGANTIK